MAHSAEDAHSRVTLDDQILRDWFVQRYQHARQPCQSFLMWVRATTAFFRTEYHPSKDETPQSLNLKSFAPEMRAFFHALGALVQQGIRLIPSEMIERHQFTEYLFQLIRDEVGWPVLKRPHVDENGPVGFMIDFFDDAVKFRTLSYHMSQNEQLAYPAFSVLGHLYQQKIMQSPVGLFVLRHSLIPEIDEIPHRLVRSLGAQVTPKRLRSRVGWTLAKLYQWLGWLNLLPAVTDDMGVLLRSYLVFILIRSDLDRLFRVWGAKTDEDPEMQAWYETMETVEFVLRMEMKKVFHRELVGYLELKRPAALYTHLENSQGILRTAIQSAIVTIIQVVRPEVDGRSLFPSYQTKLEQSLRLREDLMVLKQKVLEIQKTENWGLWKDLINNMQRFRNTSMRYLMYRDWHQFEVFIDQVQNITSVIARKSLLDQLHTYISTLLKEINQRDVLRDHPMPETFNE